MSTPRPTATGSLDSTPLVNLLIYVLDHELTGTLVLEEPGSGQKHAVYFVMGAPNKVKTAQPTAYLGNVLVELGSISEEIREATLAQAQSAGDLHGRVLCDAGHIDATALRAGLREQLAQQLVYLAARPTHTVFGYYDQVNLLQRWGGDGVRGRPLQLIWRVVLRHVDTRQVVTVLERLGDAPLRLHNDAPLQRFHFGRPEQALIDVLRAKPQPLSEVLGREMLERASAERLIYTLAITRQFAGAGDALPLGVDEPPSSIRPAAPPYPSSPPEFGLPFFPAAAASSSSGLRASVPEPTEAPEITAFREALLARAAREDATHYEVLEVTRDTPPTEIQGHFLALAKKWHPDRVPVALASMKELASRVFSRMTEASQVLSDPLQRREYDQKLRRAGKEAEEAEHVQRVLRAATAFQKAEVFMKRGNLAAAEAEARQALADDPDQSDYIALVAWLDAQKPEPNLETSIKALDRAILLQPNSVRAHWYRGQLYQRLGRRSRAIRDFRAVVERDPRHVDAQRELRLYQMRRGETPTSIPPSDGGARPSPPPAPLEKSGDSRGGLLSKLFRR